jgi:CoA:oxalate CoA-transferase
MKQKGERNSKPRMPLEGVTVVSVEQVVTAPFCSMMLADRGAKVIKIEQPGLGDPMREAKAHPPWRVEKDGKSMSQEFIQYNRNKKSITLNLKTREAQEILKKLIRTADVFIENLRPGAVERWGIDRRELRRINPRLIHVVISGFGLTGPYRNWPAYDPIIQAMGGLADRLGMEDGSPCLAPLAFSDLLTSVPTAYAIAEALFTRERTGEGAFIDMAMYDCTIFFNEREMRYYALNKELQPRGRDVYAPFGIFRAGDGRYVSFYISMDSAWEHLCKAIGREDIIDAPEFNQALVRSKNRDSRIIPILEEWAKDKTAKQVVTEIMEAGAPVGLVQTAEEVHNCEQVRARKMLVEIDDPVYGKTKLPRAPIITEGYEETPASPPPQLGEHNEEILGQLGYTIEQLNELRSKGVI